MTAVDGYGRVAPVATPTLRRRRLAAELRRLRETAGLRLDQAASEADLAKSTLSRIETAQIGCRPVVVRALLTLYGVSGPEAESLIQLARDAKQRGWWQAFGDVLTSQYADYISLESEALSVRNYEPLFVPGLLQTPQYARAVIHAVLVSATEEEIERRVEVRTARQQRLTASVPVDFWAIIDEAALRRPTGTPEIMRDQLAHIVEMMRLPNVTVQVLPTAIGAHPGMVGSFSVLEFPDQQQPDVVYVDCVAGELFLESESDARRVNMLYNHLRTKALDRDTSSDLIRALISNSHR